MEKIKFNSEYLAEILKQFFSKFSCIPVKVDNEVKLIFWECGNCLRDSSCQHENAIRDCKRFHREFGNDVCWEMFKPVDMEGKRYDWFERLCDYITSSTRGK